jgi:hypothetical protein
MRVEDRNLEHIEVRHASLQGALNGTRTVAWYGACVPNLRDRTLPRVVTWFYRINDDGTVGLKSSQRVGITDLGMLQIGTLWKGIACRTQIRFEERQFEVDYTEGNWRITSQAKETSDGRGELVPDHVYPLPYGAKDRSEVLVFNTRQGGQLLVPCLEFFTRCYGRSAHVNRVLATYPWTEAEPRLHLPVTQPVPASHWAIKLASKTINDDAILLAHIKYDSYAARAAKWIHADLNAQFTGPASLAFPAIGPWFQGPAKLLVEGVRLDKARFLALRVTGMSEPRGPKIWSFRENEGQAEEAAAEGAAITGWRGGRSRELGNIPSMPTLTADDAPDYESGSVEVRNPVIKILGTRRDVEAQPLAHAKTRPSAPVPSPEARQHAAGERQGSGRGTGWAAIRTETKLQSEGAARDVWNALQFLKMEHPDVIQQVGWFSLDTGTVNVVDPEPSLTSLLPREEEEQRKKSKLLSKWVFADVATQRVRGVLIAVVTTPSKTVFLFELERRVGLRTAGDGSSEDKEESFCGLVVAKPPGLPAAQWIARVLHGIRSEEGVMSRVTDYCPERLGEDYRRSTSEGDVVAGQSTVISALQKVGVKVPRPNVTKKNASKKPSAP